MERKTGKVGDRHSVRKIMIVKMTHDDSKDIIEGDQTLSVIYASLIRF